MEPLVKKLFYIAACLTLSACLEPQPAPEVTYIPSTDFTIETLSEDMRKPWGVASLPEGGYLVTEFEGGLIYIEDGKTTDIAVNPLNFYVKGQGGFMGIVLAPDFQQSREVFFSYAYEDGDQNSTAIMRARFENGALENPKTIFKSSSKDTGSHFGGRMVFLPDETLVLTLGDGFAYREEAQNLENDLGKIVRLKRDGSPADGNPFADNENAKPDIYSYGHRNVQGLAYDSESGNLWAHEHGPRGGDELNLIKPIKTQSLLSMTGSRRLRRAVLRFIAETCSRIGREMPWSAVLLPGQSGVLI